MMSAPRSANALREQGVAQSIGTTDHSNFTPLCEAIKAQLLAGCAIRLIDYPNTQRPTVIGVIATLRDELPIRTGWQTVRESHLSQTRLRARRYSIPGEFLRDQQEGI